MRVTDDTVVVNCSECGQLCLSRIYRDQIPAEDRKKHDPPLVAGHINGKPICPGCAAPRPLPGHVSTLGEPSPWQENAVKHMEDG